MTSTPTEERVQRAARKLLILFPNSSAAYAESHARAILEAADAPEPQKVVVTSDMLDAGFGAAHAQRCPNSDDLVRIYTAMRPLEPEPVVTQEVAMAMYTAYETTIGRMDEIPCAQAVLSAAHRVLRGK